MQSFIRTLMIIYPLLISLLLLIVLLTVELESTFATTISINFGFTSLNIPLVKSLWVLRYLLIIAIIGFAVYPLFRDYSQIFPRNYKLIVSYDDDEIATALKELSSKEMDRYKIEKDWPQEKIKIWDMIMKEKIYPKMKENISAEDVPMVSVNGYTYFIIKKAGFLRYDLENSYGNLDHELQLPDGKLIKVFTRFQLSQSQRFDVKLSDIYLRRGIIVDGKFSQFLISTNDLLYLFDIKAVTKVKFLPYLCIGKTIYLYETTDKKMVPIGLATNSSIERD